MPLFYQKYEGYTVSGTAYITAASIDFASVVPTIILTSGSFPSAGTYVLMRANSYLNVPASFPSSLSSGITPPAGLTVSSVIQYSTDIVVTLI